MLNAPYQLSFPLELSSVLPPLGPPPLGPLLTSPNLLVFCYDSNDFLLEGSFKELPDLGACGVSKTVSVILHGSVIAKCVLTAK